MEVKRTETITIEATKPHLIAMLKAACPTSLPVQAMPPLGGNVEVTLRGSTVILTYTNAR